MADTCFSVEGTELSVLEGFEASDVPSWSFQFTHDFDDTEKIHPVLCTDNNQPVITGYEDKRVRGRIDAKRQSASLACGPNETYLMRSALHWALENSGAFLVHACALNLEGRGLLIPGASGAGKSTVASRFDDSALLSDEMVAIRNKQLHKTPFRKGGAESAEGRVVLFPVHDAQFSLNECSLVEAFEIMLPRVVMAHEETEQIDDVMNRLEDFLISQKLFKMHFSLECDLLTELKGVWS